MRILRTFLGITVSILLFACGGQTSTPTKTYETFKEAIRTHSVGLLVKCLYMDFTLIGGKPIVDGGTAARTGMLAVQILEKIRPDQIGPTKVVETREDGDIAIAVIHDPNNTAKPFGEVKFARVDGEWRIFSGTPDGIVGAEEILARLQLWATQRIAELNASKH